jgi:acetyl-CoA decarbonylase/synthase complex subunit delta
MLQAPIMTLVGSECWNVKEAVVSQEDMPQWGSQEDRGVAMELTTAAACLASGSNAVILRQPRSVKAPQSLLKLWFRR